MYLREKKNYCDDNSYGWYSWKFEYKLDYSVKRKYVKLITINAYIQKDRTDRWSDHYEEKLTIYKTITIIKEEKNNQTHETLLSEGYFDW